MVITLVYFDDCPNWRVTDEHLRSLQPEFGFELHHRRVESPEAAEELGFRGSPSIVVDGDDLFADDGRPIGLTCRIYRAPDGPAGTPTVEQIAEALRSRQA